MEILPGEILRSPFVQKFQAGWGSLLSVEKLNRYFSMTRGQMIRIFQEASQGVYKAIKSRRQILRCMRDNLLKRSRKRVYPDQIYKLRTIYERGPVILREIAQLKKIKRDLDLLIRQNL